MKVIKEQRKKIIITFFVVLILFNTVFIPSSQASVGGTLFGAIKDLILRIRRCRNNFYAKSTYARIT